MKLIIPIAEKVVIWGPQTHITPRALMNLAGKPLIVHILDSVSNLKIDKVIFIVHEDNPELRKIIKKNYSFDTAYIKQKKIKGIGHAIYGAKQHVSNEEVAILLGDTLIEANFNKLSKLDADGVIWTKKVEDPSKFGVVFMYENHITRLIEKPDLPISDLAIVGMYYFKNSKFLFDALEHIITNDITTKGRYQLTDAIQVMINNGQVLDSKTVDKWLDCGNVQNLLETNKYLLNKTKSKTGILENSVIIKPVNIDKSSKIINSIIGPYVSVGKNVVIKKSIIQESIINESSNIEDISLKECLIGKNAIVKGLTKKLNIGDSSKINYT